jgi:hypothetical protein
MAALQVSVSQMGARSVYQVTTSAVSNALNVHNPFFNVMNVPTQRPVLDARTPF